jgi:hypothetical protein
LHTLLGQPIAQFAQEDARLLFVGGQDPVTMRLDPMRGVVATRRPGGELSLLLEALRPAAGARHADPEAGCGPMARSTCRNSGHDTLA